MGQTPRLLTCPFLGEVVMEYCSAYPIRKPVPKGRFASGICASGQHANCPYFNDFLAGHHAPPAVDVSSSQASEDQRRVPDVFCPSLARNACSQESLPEPHAHDTHRARHRRRVGLRQVNGVALHPGFFYHRGHTWVMPYAVEEARIGLNDLGRRLLHGLRKIHLPPRKALLREGQAAVEIDCGDRRAWLASPVDAVVTACNEDLAEDLSLIEADPYGDGWLLAVRLRDDSFATLPTGSAASEWMRTETDRLCALLADELGPTAADGGDLVQAPAAALSPQQWEAVAEAFFLHHAGFRA